jgi:hypothetical protein
MMCQDAIKSELLITFMTRLIKDTGRKIFLIPNDFRLHHSKNIKQW